MEVATSSFGDDLDRLRQVCLFVCLFVWLIFICLFVCLFVVNCWSKPTHCTSCIFMVFHIPVYINELNKESVTNR